MTPLQKSFYDEIELSEEEKEEALFEGKVKKYFRLKNADKWPEEVEKVKPKDQCNIKSSLK